MSSESRSIRGGIGPTRKTLNDDPVYRWYQQNAEVFRRSGKIFELDNPTGHPAEAVGDIGNFTIYRSHENGFMFANPRLTTEAVIEYFRTRQIRSYYEAVEESIERRREIAYVPFVNFVAPHLPANAFVLEVGCGGGGLLEVYREQAGCRVFGVEVAGGAEEFQTRRGLDVANIPIEDFVPEEKFDAVVMWSVMDHFADPIRALHRCHDALNNEGIIAIGSINTDGFDHQTIGLDINTFAPPTRVNYYNIRSLTAHLDLAGFDLIDVRTPGEMDIDIVRDYWSSGGENGRNAFLEQLLMTPGEPAQTEAFRAFLKDSRSSGFQMVMAKKRDR